VLAAIHDCGAALATPATHLLVPARSIALPGPYNPTAAPQVVVSDNDGASSARDSTTHSGTEIASALPPIELQMSLPGVAGTMEAVSAHATRSPPSSGAAGAAAAVAVKGATGNQHSHSVGTTASSRFTSANASTVPPIGATRNVLEKPGAAPNATTEAASQSPVSAAAWRT
jgi:hypothetical protein